MSTTNAPTSPPVTPASRATRTRRRMIGASLLVVLGAVSPWVEHVGGTTLGVQGAGLWTLAAGGMGLAGAMIRHHATVVVHAVLLAATPLVLGTWQLFHLWRIGCDLRVCAPSFGLVLTLAGGVLAATVVHKLLGRGGSASPPG